MLRGGDRRGAAHPSSPSHRADEVDSLAGIVNCTCNYIITRFEQAELSFDDALAERERWGWSRATAMTISVASMPPKLSILVYRAFGAWVRPDSFPFEGFAS